MGNMVEFQKRSQQNIQGDKGPRGPTFGDCFLARSFGLVGRTTAAIQPRQAVYSGSNFQKSSHQRGALSPCSLKPIVSPCTQVYICPRASPIRFVYSSAIGSHQKSSGSNPWELHKNFDRQKPIFITWPPRTPKLR